MRRASTGLLLIWLAFVVRGGFYALSIPIWEGFDEYAHFAFVHHVSTFGTLPARSERISAEIDQSLSLAPLPWSLKQWPAPSLTHDMFWQQPAEVRAQRVDDLRRLPSQLQRQRGNEDLYEWKQPPLFYWIGAAVLKVAAAGLPARVFTLRLVNVLIASLLVPITYLIARAAFGEPGLALGAAAILTALPGLFITITRVSNDALAIVLFSLATLWIVRGDTGERRPWIYLGVTLGAGFLTKAYFVASIPAVLLAALVALVRSGKGKRLQCLLSIAISLSLPLLIAGWWYAGSLTAGSGVWVDVAPTEGVPIRTLLPLARTVDWWRAASSAFDAHIWLGGWSFLGVPGWMYTAFRAVFLLSFAGAILGLIRSRPIERRHLMVFVSLYAGFWLALMYDAFISFVNSGTPATTGYYLHAAVAPEVLILAAGLYCLRPLRSVLAGVVGLFVLLEMYATHFVLIPYYTGIIRHNADGGLPALHLSQALELGWGEILARLHLNRPEVLAYGMFLPIWIVFICSTLLVPLIAPLLLDQETRTRYLRRDSR